MRTAFQGARRTVEDVAAAQGILPFWERRFDISPRRTVIRLPQLPPVKQDIDRRNAGAGQGPPFYHQTADHRIRQRTTDNDRIVELELEFGLAERSRRRREDYRGRPGTLQ